MIEVAIGLSVLMLVIVGYNKIDWDDFQFTLTEVMILVAIIGVVVSIAIPHFAEVKKNIEKAEQQESLKEKSNG